MTTPPTLEQQVLNSIQNSYRSLRLLSDWECKRNVNKDKRTAPIWDEMVVQAERIHAWDTRRTKQLRKQLEQSAGGNNP